MRDFGIIWEAPKRPCIGDALVEVRLQALADGIVIPEDAESIVTEHLPSDTNPNGSLHVVFEWDGRTASNRGAEEGSRREANARGHGRPSPRRGGPRQVSPSPDRVAGADR